jgi:hypothetical protein
MSNNEDKENSNIDLDSIKRQLLINQESYLKEQTQSGINDTEDNINKLIIDEQELKSKISTSDFFEYVIKAVKKTVKCEDVLIRQILLTGLSSYIEEDPINLGILGPTSEGKTYPVEECIKFFSKEDVYKVGSMSAKVLVRDKGILVDKNLNPIEDKIRELKNKAKRLPTNKSHEEEKEQINEELEKLYKDAKTLIDLRGKILVFLEPPQKEVWEILKPILSHDSFEIEFPFVNQTDREGHQTKNVVVRGWPSCIFCSARDESNWPLWPEIKSRFLITSPNMVSQKYQESTKILSSRYGLPNIIQQQTIISDIEVDQAKQCILLIKQKINQLKLKNNNRKISVWIPYLQLLQKELPANKGTDVRFVKRIFAFLNIVPIVKLNLRKVLVLEGEISVIADLQDLKEVLSITQNFDGLPKFKADFFNEIFYPCFLKKIKPESNADDKEEEIIAVTTRELCDYFKEIHKKPISTDNLKHTYLNQFINDGIIDYTKSKIDIRQNIYYPLVTEKISNISIKDRIDNLSQENPLIYEKIIKEITQSWIFCEIMKLIRCRLDFTNLQLIDYVNNNKNFQLFDSLQKGGEQNKIGEGKNLTIGKFTQKYFTHNEISPIDNKSSNILIEFAKRSQLLSILAKIDLIDKQAGIEELKGNR